VLELRDQNSLFSTLGVVREFFDAVPEDALSDAKMRSI
jgi:hypothetical protein